MLGCEALPILAELVAITLRLPTSFSHGGLMMAEQVFI
jgi:hypothetical protein